MTLRALNDSDLCRLLDDDTASGDLTTASLAIGHQPARLEFRARQAMTVCASEEALRLLHRLGLSETLLLFAEHRLFLDASPAQTIAQLKRAQPEKKIIVEVADLQEALRWAEAGADVLQLEKFTPGAAGADLLVTSAPYTAPPRDVQVNFFVALGHTHAFERQ